MQEVRVGWLDKARSRACVCVLMTADAAVVLASIIIAHTLRFDYQSWPAIYRHHLSSHAMSVPVVVGLYLISYAFCRLYRCAWRFASLDMLWGVIWANTIGLLALVVVQCLVDGGTFPWSVLVILWATSIVLVGGVRVTLRVLSIARKRGVRSILNARRRDSATRVVIMGAGLDGVRTLRATQEDPRLDYDVVGFLDDDPMKHGTYIGRTRVLGPIKSVKELAAAGAVDEVIVAVPDMDANGVRESVIECRRNKIPVKSVPLMRDVLTGSSNGHLQEFSVEDLLRRQPVDTTVADIAGYIANRRVMVTGAGGSIGSELCRQIASLQPASLVLLGHGENSIHSIYHELLRSHPHMKDSISYVVASTANQQRVNQAVGSCRPEVIFHAAAHKHLPMMEGNEQEAVLNNVLGTFYPAAAAGECGVERIVLISTDKAADPCCVMGATKWLCEEIFRAASSLWTGTAFVAVRFGNVLGSRGSVVPVFREQIRQGGPVTVTDPEMTRYFMTIPEAVRLVLEAGSVGKSGDLYLLDMGKPVKILDLAKDMIRLSGLEPGVDIDIQLTGIRPGEKLHEQLVSDRERIEKTPWQGLSLVCRPEHFAPTELLNTVDTIEKAVTFGTDSEVRRILDRLVPGCKQQEPTPHLQQQAYSGSK